MKYLNTKDVHSDISRKIFELYGSGEYTPNGFWVVSDPAFWDWLQLEKALYGFIDPECDRLVECISWRDTVEENKPLTLTPKEVLRADIQQDFTSLDDWHKYQTMGAWGYFGSSTIDEGVAYLLNGLGREYCGAYFYPTGREKVKRDYAQYAGFGFEGHVESSTITYYQYGKGDVTFWSCEKKEVIKLPTEEKILSDIQDRIINFCLTQQISWAQFLHEIEKKKKINRENAERDAAAKLAAASAIPEPEWYRREVSSKCLSKIDIGSKRFMFFWAANEGCVKQECKENGVKTVTSLGSDRDSIISYIKSLHEEEEEYLGKRTLYQKYKENQVAKGGLVKSFDKWVRLQR